MVWDYVASKVGDGGADPSGSAQVPPSTIEEVYDRADGKGPPGGRPAQGPRAARAKGRGDRGHGRAAPELRAAAAATPAPAASPPPRAGAAAAAPMPPTGAPAAPSDFRELTSSWLNPRREEVEELKVQYTCHHCGHLIELRTRWPPHYLACPRCGGKVV